MKPIERVLLCIICHGNDLCNGEKQKQLHLHKKYKNCSENSDTISTNLKCLVQYYFLVFFFFAEVVISAKICARYTSLYDIHTILKN